MSFTGDVKSELAANGGAACCKKSQLYAMLFFAGEFSHKKIRLSTESLQTAELFEKLLRKVFGVDPKACVRDNFGNIQVYDISLTGEDAEKVISGYGYGETEDLSELKRSVFDRHCCLPAFIRGAFLVCGSLQNPQKGYRLEFAFTDVKHRDILRDILFENGFGAISGNRKELPILYFKGSETIEDLLAFTGATNSCLELMNEKIYKDIRNNENRKSNCDVANISKTLLASEKQCEAILKLKSQKMFECLPDELKTVAELRLEHRDMPLSELRMMTEPPLSRSGINHRLRKLCELAEKL